MGKEELLNILDKDARTAFEAAERLSLGYGGTVSPFHIMYAGLQIVSPSTTGISSDDIEAINGGLKAALATRFPRPSEAILVTRETQSVLKELSDRARGGGKRLATLTDMLGAAAQSPSIKEWVCSDPASAGLIARVLNGLSENGRHSAHCASAAQENCAESGGHVGGSASVAVEQGHASRSVASERSEACAGSALGEFCEELASRTSPHPFIGREREVTAVLETLCRKLKNNPLLVGKPGVGKTALVGAVAARLSEGQVPARLKGKRILEVSRIRLLADARYSGEIEERLKCLLEETHSAGNVILFFDEIHTLLGAGGAQGTGDIASLLKSALSRGDITSIGATTQAEYYRYISKDEALARRFSTITIEEPSPEATLQILRGTRSSFESYHDIEIDDDALRLIVEIASRYLPSRSFPDKAFDLMDNAAAKSAMEGRKRLDRTEIIEALSEMTGLPLEIMEQDQSERLHRLEAYLNEAVPGQPSAARDISRVIGIAKLGLEVRPERPDGVFLFVGAEGAGKRETATALAEFLYGSAQKLIEFDMSQFAQGWSMSRLVGAEPGYVGYGERGGLFTKAAEDNPHSVFLFRNIDLADQVIQQFLAEAFDQGRFTDAAGTQVSISNITVVMTPSRDCEGSRTGPLGFVSEARIDSHPPAEGWSRYRIADALGATIDEVIEFRTLDRAATEKIIAARLESLRRRVASSQGVALECGPEVTGFLADRLGAERKGLAHLDRVMQELILAPLSSLCGNHGHLVDSSGQTGVAAGGIKAEGPLDDKKQQAKLVVRVQVENGKLEILARLN